MRASARPPAKVGLGGELRGALRLGSQPWFRTTGRQKEALRATGVRAAGAVKARVSRVLPGVTQCEHGNNAEPACSRKRTPWPPFGAASPLRSFWGYVPADGSDQEVTRGPPR